MRELALRVVVTLAAIALASTVPSGLVVAADPNVQVKNGCVEVGVKVDPESAKPGDRGVVSAFVANTGSSRDWVTVHLSLVLDDLSIAVAEISLRLGPGEKRAVSVTFEVPKGVRPGTYLITAEATSRRGCSDTAYAKLAIS